MDLFSSQPMWIQALAVVLVIFILYYFFVMPKTTSKFDPYENTISDYGYLGQTNIRMPLTSQYAQEYGSLVDQLQTAIDWTSVKDYNFTNPFPHMIDLIKAIVADESKITGQTFATYQDKVAEYKGTKGWCDTYKVSFETVMSNIISSRNLTTEDWLNYSPDVSQAAAELAGTVKTKINFADTYNTMRAVEWARIRNYDTTTLVKALQADQVAGGTDNLTQWAVANKANPTQLIQIMAQPDTEINSIEDALEATLSQNDIDDQVRYARDNVGSIPWRPEVEIETVTPAVPQIGISRVRQVQYPQEAGNFTNDYVRPQLTREVLEWNGQPM